MKIKGVLFPALVTSMVLAACGGDPPPPPEPTGPTAEELEQMRQDSIRAAREAEEARLAAEEARRRAEAARQATIREAREDLEMMIFFEFDSDEITSASEEILRAKLPVLRNSPTITLRLEGHADERGSNEYNLALGSRRAQSAMDWLTSFGIDVDRLATTSFGEDRPLVNRSDEEAWARNRRVEFVITGGEVVVTENDSDRQQDDRP